MKNKNNYTLKSCEELIEKYIDLGGEMHELNEGTLGLGFIILHGAVGKKSILIREYYISAWVSGHEITMYNKLPKKYQNLINN